MYSGNRKLVLYLTVSSRFHLGPRDFVVAKILHYWIDSQPCCVQEADSTTTHGKLITGLKKYFYFGKEDPSHSISTKLFYPTPRLFFEEWTKRAQEAMAISKIKRTTFSNPTNA